MTAVLFVGDQLPATFPPQLLKYQSSAFQLDVLQEKFPQCGSWHVVFPSRIHEEGFSCYDTYLHQSTTPTGEPVNGLYLTTPPVAAHSLLEDLHLPACSGSEAGSIAPTACSDDGLHLVGFSKGGVVLNQIIAELAGGSDTCDPALEFLFRHLRGIHYVDVGLNSPGAYLHDEATLRSFARGFVGRGQPLPHVTLFGTWRQWQDRTRPHIDFERRAFAACLRRAGVGVSVQELTASSKTRSTCSAMEALDVHMQSLVKFDPS